MISEETTEDANSTLHIIENHQSRRLLQNNKINNINGNGSQVTANYNEYSGSNTTTDELTDEGNFTSTNFTINTNFRDSTGFQTFNNQQTSSAEFSINKTETYRDPDSFADIVRGMHLYGRKILRPEALVTAKYNLA